MPSLPSALLLNTLVARNTTTTATNATSQALQVVCAWPVSGQYGPSSRFLFYALIAACLFARKEEWLRNALLVPAIAALHGIVLTALHVDGAVDMDVYGAFQLCSIGILAIPVMSTLSERYFYDPGRNLIFLWIFLILAGLLSLTVEFIRLKTSNCTHDDYGNPISLNVGEFPYGTTCGLTCSVDQGPFSRMRGGSANNIYVIPAPDKLTFGMATLLAAGGCIPAVLSLITMWSRIFEINWKKLYGREGEDEVIEGTNGATIKNMRNVNDLIKTFLNAAEASVFGLAALAIVIIGERNFFSSQVYYQSEPMAAIGQWAPLSGAIIAALMVLYLFLAVNTKAVTKEATLNTSTHHCNCMTHKSGTGLFAASSYLAATPGATNVRPSSLEISRESPSEIVPTTSRPGLERDHNVKGAGSRLRVAKALIAFNSYLGTPAQDQFDYSDFKRGKAVDFPEIPGESLRNEALPQIREQYNRSRDEDGNFTYTLRASRSRADSLTNIISSGISVAGSSTSPTAASFASPFAPPSMPPSPQATVLPAEQPLFELQNFPSSSGSASATRGMVRQREGSFEAPSPDHYNSPAQNDPCASDISSIVNTPRGQSSPAIVISSDPSTSSFAHAPTSNPPASSSPAEPLPTPSTPASPPPS